jgi:hypothetical protein
MITLYIFITNIYFSLHVISYTHICRQIFFIYEDLLLCISLTTSRTTSGLKGGTIEEYKKR